MSDDPVMAALARLEANAARLEASIAGIDGRVGRIETSIAGLDGRIGRIESEQTRLREQLNTKMDDILDKITAIRTDADTTRAHVLYGLQENLTLSQRITKLEEEMRRHWP